MKVAMSAQKALQESETETRELLKEQKRIVFPRQGVIDLPYRQINDFYKKETEKIELVARTETSQKLASSSRPAQALTTTTSQSLEVVEISEVPQNPAKGLNRNENNNKTVKEERVHRDRDKKNNVVVKTVSVGTKTSGISLTQPKDSSRLEMHKFLIFLSDRPTCLLCDQEIWIR